MTEPREVTRLYFYGFAASITGAIKSVDLSSHVWYTELDYDKRNTIHVSLILSISIDVNILPLYIYSELDYDTTHLA